MAKKTRGGAYVVGYGKPPAQTQFKPGQSGNGKGRPKGSQNMLTLIEKELNVRVPVLENGRHKTISKRQAIAKQIVNKAAAGDPKATPMLLKTLGPEQEDSKGGPSRSTLASPDDALVMASIVRRVRQMDEPSPSDSAPPTLSPAAGANVDSEAQETS